MSINSSSVKVEFQTSQYKTNILQVKGQFYLECQGQGHWFANKSETFKWSINSSS